MDRMMFTPPAGVEAADRGVAVTPPPPPTMMTAVPPEVADGVGGTAGEMLERGGPPWGVPLAAALLAEEVEAGVGAGASKGEWMCVR